MAGVNVLAEWMPTLMVVLARVAGIFLVAPVFSHPAVPVKLRYAIAVAVALAAVGAMGRFAGPVALPAGWLPLAGVLAVELAVGATLGYAARLVFVGVELAALHVGQQMGLALAEVYDPAGGESGGVVRRLFVLTAVVCFLSIGGHRQLLTGLLASFEAVPPAGFAPGKALLGHVTALLGASFVLALRLAAPVLAAMLLATAALGLLQRAVPQCHALSIGLGVRAMLGLLAAALALAALPALLEAAWSTAAETIARAIARGG